MVSRRQNQWYFNSLLLVMVGDGSPFDMTLIRSPPPYKVAEASLTAECGDTTRLKGSTLTLGKRRRRVSRQSGRNYRLIEEKVA